MKFDHEKKLNREVNMDTLKTKTAKPNHVIVDFVSILCMSDPGSNFSTAHCPDCCYVSVKIRLWNGHPDLKNKSCELSEIGLKRFGFRFIRISPK